MEKNKYAFYITEREGIKDLLKKGDVENILIAEFVQKRGEDISRHGSPMYDTETTLTDIKTGKQFHHSHYDAHRLNRVDYIRFDELEHDIDNMISHTENKIDELMKEIEKLEKQKENLKSSEKLLTSRMDEIQNLERNDVQEPKLDNTNILYARFNAKQIKQHFEHPSKVDRDGKPLKMVNILIPSKEFRHFRFGTDSHGFERDNIQAYWSSIKGLVRTDQDKDGNAKKNGKRYIYLNRNVDDPVYKVRFEPQVNENGAFIEPDPVYLSARQISKIYNEQYMIGKERKKERDPNKMLEEKEEKQEKKRKQNLNIER